MVVSGLWYSLRKEKACAGSLSSIINVSPISTGLITVSPASIFLVYCGLIVLRHGFVGNSISVLSRLANGSLEILSQKLYNLSNT